MQIHQSNNAATYGLTSKPSNSTNPAVAPPREGNGQIPSGDVEIVGVSSDRLASLATSLRDIPATRADVVQQVRERVDRGDYLTRDAAERTAYSITGR